MSKRKYQICKHCIMDTSDQEITFDENGICIHCKRYEEDSKRELFADNGGNIKLMKIVENMKSEGKNKSYDCILGVSGGVDSTYCAYLVKELGLRPLAVHMDNGWNSKLAVENIEKILKKLDINLKTVVLDWDEFKNLQLSFLKASVPDIEIPTDHAILAVLYKTACTYNIKYIISGYNIRTEAVHPRMWSHGYFDWRYIRNIQKKFGNIPLKTYPHISLFNLYYYKIVKGIMTIPILNYIEYNKNDAITILENKLKWQKYKGKHSESLYTRFVQDYIFPKKFKFDKKRAHLSTLICSGQMKRNEALSEMEESSLIQNDKQEEFEYVIKKLELSTNDFEKIMNKELKTFWDYKSYESNIFLFIIYKLIQKKITVKNLLSYFKKKLGIN